jgi:hypothetical protein
MELMCSIADEILQMLKDRGIITFEILEDYVNTTVFTNDAQVLFDGIYDILDNKL